MKLPYSWIKELSGVDWSPEKMARRLTASGSAGNAQVPDRKDFEKIVVGHTVKVEKHPHADKLVVAEVNIGGGTKTIVCGAPNCETDQKVVVALPGAVLKGEFEIKPIKMRGVASEGMICAEDELGLSDDHSGIMVLDPAAPVGEAIYDYLNLGDPVIDFEITPDRPDCLCAIGIAREAAVLNEHKLEIKFASPAETSERASDYISVRIDDPDACPRYTARIVKGVKIGPSPDWMQKRLQACGVRPINNIVDITNYVLLETNQPLHAFDYDRFGSKEVVVRRAKKAEKFTTLDGIEHELDENCLMITNGKKSVATGGVMGGLDSEVTDETVNILLESAYFNPSVIRKSARKLGYSTESSYRFERGVDPAGVPVASDRAAALMVELAGGTVLQGIIDAYPKKIEPTEISLRPQRVNQLLGTDLSARYMIDVLDKLGLDIEADDPIKVKAPTFRPDLEREVDLIEEIARIYGLDNIAVDQNNSGPLLSPTHVRDTIKDDIREIMVGLGFDETISSGFAHPERMKKIDPDIEPIKVLNPISDEFGYLRPRMLYSLLISAGHNIRHRNIDLQLFEIGRIYTRDKNDPEPEYLGLLTTGMISSPYWKNSQAEHDLFELKGILSSLATGLRLPAICLEPTNSSGYDRMQSYAVKAGQEQIGIVGLVDQKVAREFDIKQKLFAAEIKISTIIDNVCSLKPFQTLPRFPASLRDIAVVVDNKIAAGDLLTTIRESGGDLVESAQIFDLFTGQPVPDGKKSLAFSVAYRSQDKTLSDNEIEDVHNKIVAALSHKFRAQLRE